MGVFSLCSSSLTAASAAQVRAESRMPQAPFPASKPTFRFWRPLLLTAARKSGFCSYSAFHELQGSRKMVDSAERAELGNNLHRQDDGIVIVDHGSRRAESNAMLEEFVEMYRKNTGHGIVEAAHMELAAPTIQDAFNRCVEQGAKRIIISPYFLFPGRHWNKDIPALAAAASKKHPGVRYLVTAPIGLHELMVKVVEDRMRNCLSRVEGKVEECEMCAGTGRCREMGEEAAQVEMMLDHVDGAAT